MSDSEEDLALIVGLLYLISQKRRQRKRRFWVHEVITRRRHYGEYH